MLDAIMDVVRREAECCEAMQCFQLVHALGGGTGSGLGTLMLDRLSEVYPDVLRTSVSLVPSSTSSGLVVSDHIVEPYNAV